MGVKGTRTLPHIEAELKAMRSHAKRTGRPASINRVRELEDDKSRLIAKRGGKRRYRL